MCGRYALFTPLDELGDRFSASPPDADRTSAPTYNAAPRQRLPVIRDAAPGTITTARWGFVPGWADDDSTEFINARAETLEEKPNFRDAYRRTDGSNGEDDPSAGRCLVLADGFYEWVDEDGSQGKRPYYVARRDDEPFAMAGLWNRWTPSTEQTDLSAFGAGKPADPGPVVTLTIVTTEPNELIAEMHHRMAAILPRADEHEWLSDSDTAAPEPIPDGELRAHPVSIAVNSPSTDDPGLIEEVEASHG